MHELSIAVSLIEEIELLLSEHNAAKVTKIVLAVGESSGVEAEALELCIPMAAENSSAEGALLQIEKVSTKVKCRECSAESEPEAPFVNCCRCSSLNVEIIAGRELIIKSLEMV